MTRLRLYQAFAFQPSFYGAMGNALEASLSDSDTSMDVIHQAAYAGAGSGDYFAIVLDPLGMFGDPEVCWVSGYTDNMDGTGTFTISRGEEGTTARAHTVGAVFPIYWAHVPTAEDLSGGATAVPEGTSFPGSPSTGDYFRRSDRGGIEYRFDGTRWLSTELKALPIVGTVSPASSSTNFLAPNPWWNLYDIWVEQAKTLTFSTTTTATNYFTHQFVKTDGTTQTNVGSSISGQNNTQNAWVGQEVTANVVVTATHELLALISTETGTSTTFILASLLYRLIG